MLAWADTKVRGRFCVKRCGPSHRRARNAPAVLKNFVRQPEKTFATVSVNHTAARAKLEVLACPSRHSNLDFGAARSNLSSDAAHSNLGSGAAHSNLGLGAAHSNLGRGEVHSNLGRGAAHSNLGRGAAHSNLGSGAAHSNLGPSIPEM